MQWIVLDNSQNDLKLVGGQRWPTRLKVSMKREVEQLI
jgi:hypothetical protein